MLLYIGTCLSVRQYFFIINFFIIWISVCLIWGNTYINSGVRRSEENIDHSNPFDIFILERIQNEIKSTWMSFFILYSYFFLCMIHLNHNEFLKFTFKQTWITYFVKNHEYNQTLYIAYFILIQESFNVDFITISVYLLNNFI